MVLRRLNLLLLLLLCVCACSRPTNLAAENWVFQIRATPDIPAAKYTGRVYVFFGKPGADANEPEPRTGPDWFHPDPFIGLDVTDWSPREPLKIELADPRLLKFPREIDPQSLLRRSAQAVIRLNPLAREVGEGAGNAFGPSVVLARPGPVELKVDQLVPPEAFTESKYFKRLRVRSDLLSRFQGREVFLTGFVQLPASYEAQPDRQYPVMLEVPGFGWSLPRWPHHEPFPERNTLGVEFIRVMLDPNCPLGHHVFANSANNGPYGDALIQEFLPALDAAFRTVPRPQARYLTGHSSGGWSTLWLLATSPEHFGGTWSTSPDPVDFRDFQQIDLYRPGENMFVDREGHRRPIARRQGHPVLYYDDFSRMEDVLGDGDQLRSFEAVFSPRGGDGRPVQLWNRDTGAIHPEIAAAWQAYDIRLQIEQNWPRLAPLLRGKIHVWMGDADTFYLEGAVRLLQASLSRLGSDAKIEILPGRDHSNLFAGGLHERIEQEMAAEFLRGQERVLQKP